MPNYKLISADSHVFEPPDLWAKRIDAGFRERAPRIQRVGDVDHLIVEKDDMVFSGFFERYPQLKVAIGEFELSQVPRDPGPHSLRRTC